MKNKWKNNANRYVTHANNDLHCFSSCCSFVLHFFCMFFAFVFCMFCIFIISVISNNCLDLHIISLIIFAPLTFAVSGYLLLLLLLFFLVLFSLLLLPDCKMLLFLMLWLRCFGSA